MLLGDSRKAWDLPSGSLQTARGSNTTAWRPAGSRAAARGGDFPLELIHGLSPFQGLLIQVSENCLLAFMLVLLMNLEQKMMIYFTYPSIPCFCLFAANHGSFLSVDKPRGKGFFLAQFSSDGCPSPNQKKRTEINPLATVFFLACP